MPDFSAISAAIAARYAPGLITPPAGLQNIRSSTAALPNGLVLGRQPRPVVLIFPDEGTLAPGNQTRTGEHSFLARFYLAESTDLARETVALQKWLTVLVDVHGTSLALGGLVVVVRTIRWRIALLPYGGKTYSGIELGLYVQTSEPWSPS